MMFHSRSGDCIGYQRAVGRRKKNDRKLAMGTVLPETAIPGRVPLEMATLGEAIPERGFLETAIPKWGREEPESLAAGVELIPHQAALLWN
jgi:hypothetical protein